MNHATHLAPYVRSFFEDHLACQRNVSPNTIQSYRDALKLFLRFAAQRLKKPATALLVGDITEAVVVAFLTDLEQTRGNSIQTRNYRLVAIRSLFEYVAGREPLHLEHGRKIASIPRKRGAVLPVIRYLEKDQIAALLGAVDTAGTRGRRDYALLLFMYNTGARVQEVADTRVTWLTLSAPYQVELLGKGRKWRTCSAGPDLRHVPALGARRSFTWFNEEQLLPVGGTPHNHFGPPPKRTTSFGRSDRRAQRRKPNCPRRVGPTRVEPGRVALCQEQYQDSNPTTATAYASQGATG